MDGPKPKNLLIGGLAILILTFNSTYEFSVVKQTQISNCLSSKKLFSLFKRQPVPLRPSVVISLLFPDPWNI